MRGRMKRAILFFLVLGLVSLLAGVALAEEPKSVAPDKALCAKMLRFGKEAYMRGRYLDAKEYFRKAIQADPQSTEAWVFYDQSVIFALAEKVEKNADLVLPDLSTRATLPAGQAPPPAAKPAKPAGKGGFRIVDDEGC